MREDKFEKGIFWELYKDLERQFEDFLEYVPYLKEKKSGGDRPRGNERIYSFKLLSLILAVGGHIDSAFKEMARYKELTNNDCRKDCKEIRRLLRNNKIVNVWLPLRAFENEYGLSTIKVDFKRLPQRENVTPFGPAKSGNNVPEWWSFYNKLKHDASLNIKKANLKTTRDALAGAFLLNVIHTPAIYRLNDFGLLKPKYGTGGFTKKVLDKVLTNSNPPATIETSVFLYDYDNGPTYNPSSIINNAMKR